MRLLIYQSASDLRHQPCQVHCEARATTRPLEQQLAIFTVPNGVQSIQLSQTRLGQVPSSDLGRPDMHAWELRDSKGLLWQGSHGPEDRGGL